MERVTFEYVKRAITAPAAADAQAHPNQEGLGSVERPNPVAMASKVTSSKAQE